MVALVITGVLIASFGEIVFSVGLGSTFNYSKVSSTKKAHYAKHYILDSAPLIEFTGFDANSVTLECSFISPYTLSPAEGIPQFQAAFLSATAYPLMLGDTPVGTGFVSDFVIEELQEKYTRFDTSGSPIEATLNVKFLQVGSLPGLGSLASSVLGIGGSVGIGPVSVSASAGLGGISGGIFVG